LPKTGIAYNGQEEQFIQEAEIKKSLLFTESRILFSSNLKKTDQPEE